MENTKQAAIVFEKGIARVTYNYDFAEVRRTGEDGVEVVLQTNEVYEDA